MINARGVTRAAAFLVLGVLCWPCYAGQPYTVTQFPGTPSGINDLGQVVGNTLGQDATAYLWLPDAAYGLPAGINLLESPPGLPRSVASAINNHGQVVGNVSTSGFLWQEGWMRILDSGLSCIAINDAGDIVGCSAGGAFLRQRGSLSYLLLEQLPGGHGNFAAGINESRQVVGQATASDGGHAVLWQNGTITDIGSPGAAYAINESGQVVGVMAGGDGETAFLWPSAFLGSLPSYTQTVAYAINDMGVVVGEAYDDNERFGHAFISEGGVMQDLNDLVDRTSYGVTLRKATGINNIGQIIVMGANGEGLLLTPIPEPATLSLLALGGAAIVRRRRVAPRADRP